MKSHHVLIASLFVAACGAPPAAGAPGVGAPGAGAALREGDAFAAGGARFRVQRLDAPPFVESDWSRRFRFDSYDNPKLATLRERYRLDDVVGAGDDEFGRQLLLLDWVNHRFRKFGRPSSPARGALDVLAANDEGHAFFCAHYADVFVSAAASLGWVARPLALRRPDHVGQGSTEHSSTEIWSNQHAKWVMFDPTFAMYVEKGGVPLNAYELRQAWFHGGGRGLVFVLDKERRRYTKADLPVFRGRHEGFGDLVLDAGAFNPYAFIGYIPNTDLMDRGPDYGRMFITKDEVCGATKWHTRDAPSDPAADPYFPIHQAALTLEPSGDHVAVTVRTLTPNFKTFLARIDGGGWKPVGKSFAWTPRAGTSRLEVKAVNQFGVEGPVSTAEVKSASPDAAP